ncbi:unnamed protein product [Victoria cruziana]
MRERRRALAGPLAGVGLLLLLLYFNFGDRLRFLVPSIPTWRWGSGGRGIVSGFVGVNGTHFVLKTEGGGAGGGASSSPSGIRLSNSPLYVNGWNSYWLMQQSIWGSTRPRVSRMLMRGAEMGMAVCRIWAFSDGGIDALQISPGHFDERVFRALDFVLAEAGKYGVRLILSLVNNLDPFGGKAQYVKWAENAGANFSASTDSFFFHPTIKSYYKAYVKSIVTRKNYYSGVNYYDDPVIFAWELMNEPRGSNSSGAILQAWINEMASYIKSLDQKHLVTVGIEGFYGHTTPEKLLNNPGEWAADLGSDFIQHSLSENIDFASVHAYPDSWMPNATLEEKVKYLAQWVDAHVTDGDKVLKKPVLFTEIGSSAPGSHGLDSFLKIIYDKTYESAKKKLAGAGVLIWQLMVEGMEEYGDRFSLVAWEKPSTFELMVQQSCRLEAVNGWSNSSKIYNCSGAIS